MTDTPMDSYGPAIESLRQDVTELREDVGVLKDDVAVLKTDVAVLKTDVAVLKADVAVLKTDVAVLKADVAVLKTDVRDLRRDMNAGFEAAQRRSDDTFNRLRMLIEGIQGDLKLALEHLAPALMDIAEHRGLLRGQSGRLDDLDTRVTALEALRSRKPS